MSCIICAAPVTRTIVWWDAHLCHLEEKKLWRCLELFCSELFVTVFSKLFIHFERIRASTIGDVERIKIIMFRAVRTAFHELFAHSERTRAATQGVICLICVICCVILCQLKYIGMCLMLFEKQLVITCPNSYNRFSTNPMQPIEVKCCRAV